MSRTFRQSLARVGDIVLDPTIVLSFDRTGYERHALNFDDGDLDVDLAGLSFAVTGANGGLGKEVTRELAARGARVWMLCRSVERGEAARAELVDDRRIAERGGELRLVRCDVSDLESIDGAVDVLRGAGLHGIVHNAGALLDERRLSPQGVEMTLATHLVGPFRMTSRLWPHLRRGRSGEAARVVWVSSGGMYPRKLDVDGLERTEGPFDGVTAYADVKRAQVVASEQIAAQLGDRGVVSNAMHPGWAATRGVEESLPLFYSLMRRLLRTPAQGADTAVWLAACERVGGESGGFWFDRRRVSPYLVPGTRESTAERERLWEALVRWSDVDPASWSPL